MNNRGFGGLLLLLAIIISIAIIMSAAIETKNNYPQANEFFDAKSKLSNFEVTLARALADCNQNVPQVKTCADTNANTLLPLIFTDEYTCIKNPAVTIDANRAYFDINCILQNPQNPSKLSGYFSKRIYVKR